MNTQKLDFIQALRGIAALAVTMLHIKDHLPEVSPELQWLLAPASSGVDLFFIISGFIMVYTTRNNDGSISYFSEFIVKRLSRLWPAYIILTLLYIVAMGISEAFINRRDIDPSLPNILMSLFFIPTGLSTDDGPFWGGSLLHTGWTLNYEIYFYLIFSVSLLFGRFRWLSLFAWTIITLLVLPGITGQISFNAEYFYNWNIPYLNLVTSPLIWEFIFGVIIGLIYISPFKIKSVQANWIYLAFSCSIAFWLLFGGFRNAYGIDSWGIPHIILFMAFSITSKTLVFKIPRVLVWLGNISFSLYLVHPIIVHPFSNIAWEIELIRPLLNGIPYVIFLSMFSIVTAAISHHYLEKKLSNMIRDYLLHLIRAFKTNKKKSNAVEG